MHYIMQNLKQNAQVFIFSVAECYSDCRRKLNSIKSERFEGGVFGTFGENSPFVYTLVFLFDEI